MKMMYIAFLVFGLVSCTNSPPANEIEYPASSGRGVILHKLSNGFLEDEIYSAERARQIAMAQSTSKKRILIVGNIIYVDTATDSWIGKIGSSRLMLPDRPGQIFQSKSGETFIREFYADAGKWGWTNMDSEQTFASCNDCPAP